MYLCSMFEVSTLGQPLEVSSTASTSSRGVMLISGPAITGPQNANGCQPVCRTRHSLLPVLTRHALAVRRLWLKLLRLCGQEVVFSDVRDMN